MIHHNGQAWTRRVRNIGSSMISMYLLAYYMS
jgi:hypothetical protein